MTFGQAWNRIKNAAVKAFEPVSKALNKMLNDAAKNGAFEKIEATFWNVSKALQIMFEVIRRVVAWVVDNWGWLQHLIVAGLIIMASYWAYQGAMAVWSCIETLIAMGAVTWAIMIAVAAVFALAYIFILWKTGAIDTCQAIISALLVVGAAVALIGLLIGGWVMVIVGLVIAAIGLILNYLDYFLAGLYSIVSVIWNLIVTLVTTIIQNAILPLTVAWDNFANFFGNLFNDPIAAIIRCFEKLADSVLSILETIAKGIDAVFGSNLASAVQGWRSGLSSKADELVNTYGNGTYKEKSNVTDKVNGVLSSVQDNLLWNTADAWNTGMEHGTVAKDWLNNLGSKFQTGFGGLDSLGEKLGINFGSGFPTSSGSALGYDIPNTLDQIAGDTDDISDAMKLSAEDLEYLRKIAEMEWKKEFTTASIKIDMSNYNNINNESDLDGIVTKLTEKLYEEMNVVANGVYA
jgi:hypothetical protein